MILALVVITWIGLGLSYFLTQEENIVLILSNRLFETTGHVFKWENYLVIQQLENTEIVDILYGA